jgi:formate hydrogenlyase subunit 4
MNASAVLPLAASLLLAPALPGVVQRTKALLAGRRGAPTGQLYFDLWKLLRKGTIVSRTSSGLLPMLPSAILAATVVAALLAPLEPAGSVLGFPGDFVAFAGLLALGRYLWVLAGLESGSSFQGMGASRDVTIAAFAEPALFLCLACLALISGAHDLSGMFGASAGPEWVGRGPALVLIAGALFVLLLAETAQVPVDDPATHLELTMVHEVVALDLGGPDLGYVLYAAALKFALLASLIPALFWPGVSALPLAGVWWVPAGALAVAAAVGLVAGLAARLRLDRLPEFLTAAIVLGALALVLTLR